MANEKCVFFTLDGSRVLVVLLFEVYRILRHGKCRFLCIRSLCSVRSMADAMEISIIVAIELALTKHSNFCGDDGFFVVSRGNARWRAYVAIMVVIFLKNYYLIADLFRTAKEEKPSINVTCYSSRLHANVSMVRR